LEASTLPPSMKFVLRGWAWRWGTQALEDLIERLTPWLADETEGDRVSACGRARREPAQAFDCVPHGRDGGPDAA
jgi:hypothetical protein